MSEQPSRRTFIGTLIAFFTGTLAALFSSGCGGGGRSPNGSNPPPNSLTIKVNKSGTVLEVMQEQPYSLQYEPKTFPGHNAPRDLITLLNGRQPLYYTVNGNAEYDLGNPASDPPTFDELYDVGDKTVNPGDVIVWYF